MNRTPISDMLSPCTSHYTISPAWVNIGMVDYNLLRRHGEGVSVINMHYNVS